MQKVETDILEASAALSTAIAAARTAGYRVSYQSSGGDPYVVVDGGPEPLAAAAVPDGAPASLVANHPDEENHSF